jgi:hypothetical protein
MNPHSYSLDFDVGDRVLLDKHAAILFPEFIFCAA